jgi:hypothetical protein
MKRDRGARTSEVNGHNEAAVAGTDATGLPLAIDDATSARVKINRGPPGMAEEVDTSGERARRISVLSLWSGSNTPSSSEIKCAEVVSA